MRRNKNVIYTGKVGARMPMRKQTPKAARRSNFIRGVFKCEGGPYAGRAITLDSCSDLKSLTIRVRGQVGRYFGPNWIPAQPAIK